MKEGRGKEMKSSKPIRGGGKALGLLQDTGSGLLPSGE